MDELTRRSAMKLGVGAGLFTLAAADDASAQGVGAYEFNRAPASESCRLLARTIAGTKATATAVAGIINNTYVLIVEGKKPYLNMTVRLSPLIYVRQPEYWGIEVIGCVPGIALPTIGAYSEFLPLDGIRGTKGIEVIWAEEKLKIDVPPK